MITRQFSLFATAVVFMACHVSTNRCRANVPRGFFTDIMNVGPISEESATEFVPFVSPDGLTLYFSQSVEFGQQFSGGQGGEDMWMAIRPNLNEPFGNVTNLGPDVNSPFNEHVGSVSPDGSRIYFGTNRDGDTNLYQATLDPISKLFGNVKPLGPGVNTPIIEGSPRVSADGRTLVYQVVEPGQNLANMDVYMADRGSPDVPFGNARRLQMNRDDVADWWPSLSSDGLTLFTSDWNFQDPRPGGEGQADIWVSIRPNTEAPFEEPVNLNELWPDSNINTNHINGAPYISPDWPANGSYIYWMGTGPGPLRGNSDIYQATWVSLGRLQAGDADLDLDFDQFDLVKVQQAAKYLTGQPATWGEGDWDGAPGGDLENPPPGDGQFNQLDIIAALTAGKFPTRPFAAVKSNRDEGNRTLIYDPATGELQLQVRGPEMTSISIESAAAIFTGDSAESLSGSFGNDSDQNIFKATFGGSFGSLSFGNVARSGMSREYVLNDLSAVASLIDGEMGHVDLVYVPEPSTMLSCFMSAIALITYARRIRRQFL